MLNEKDVYLGQEHYKELLRQAERERMIRQALAANKRVGFRERALAWLGGYFVAWGCYLQRRYALGVVDDTEVASFDPAGITSDCGCVS
jgi:hypothetical protein